jgi:hypothetical protein
MLILFTGPSGLESSQALTNFIDKFDFQASEKPHYIKVEALIISRYLADKKIEPSQKNNTVWKKFLREPYKIQEKYWDDALLKVDDQISELNKKESNPVIFLNFHACYFHRKTLEYFSLVNLPALSKHKPDIIITLIDDIYEMHHRMRLEPGDVFYAEVTKSSSDVILDYMRVLDWRSKEIMTSRFIAKNLGRIPCYVFAIKHNFDIFYNLIYGKHPTAYLSHPISEVRRLEASSESNKRNKADRLKHEILTISDELCSHFAIFLPTTIDEFRIKMEKVGSEKFFCSTLLPRWDADQYKEPHNLLYQTSGFEDRNELWVGGNTITNETTHQLLKTLSATISAQVTTRDYMLVEQSKYLILYRPLFNGNQSGGVEKERSYHSDLIRVAEALGSSSTSKTKVYVYCPADDIRWYMKSTFEFCIADQIKRNVMACLEKEFEEIDEEEFKRLLAHGDDKEGLKELLVDILHKYRIHISDPEFKKEAPLFDKEETVNDLYNNMVDYYVENITNVKSLFDSLVDDYPEHSIFDLKKTVKQILIKFEK